MDRETLLELVTTLGKEFQRHGMKHHVEALRVYYLAVVHGLARPPDFRSTTSWDSDFVVRWFGLLRLPPYQDLIPKRKSGDKCEKCGPNAMLRSGAHLPDGSFEICCNVCGGSWLVLEPIAVTAAARRK